MPPASSVRSMVTVRAPEEPTAREAPDKVRTSTVVRAIFKKTRNKTLTTEGTEFHRGTPQRTYRRIEISRYKVVTGRNLRSPQCPAKSPFAWLPLCLPQRNFVSSVVEIFYREATFTG